MTRVLVLGGSDLHEAAAALGLTVTPDRDAAGLALVDLRIPAALRAAAALPVALPRVVVADPTQRALACALAVPDAHVASSCEPAALGPIIRLTMPAAPSVATRVIVATAACGGTGRTLLVANLARRLAARCPVLVVDATGTGAAGWWLGVRPRPWVELERLAGELTADHLALVAEEAMRDLRVVGAAPHAPTAGALEAVVRVGRGVASVVLVDAPCAADERLRAVGTLADRILVTSHRDPLNAELIALAELPVAAWHVVSQAASSALRPDEFFALPRDDVAVGLAAATRGAVGGRLGRAYDDLAALVLEDVLR